MDQCKPTMNLKLCHLFHCLSGLFKIIMHSMGSLIYPDESYRIRGACFEVYKVQGCGFTEPIYQECLEAELGHQGIPFEAQCPFSLHYKGQRLRHTFIPDLVCFGKIILELKAVPRLVDDHRAQILNYLQATGLKLGLLINFGHHPKIQIERFLNLECSGGLAGRQPKVQA